MQWRLMEEKDLPGVIRAADAIHAAYPEDDAVFIERLRLYPGGCHVLATDGDIAGYMLSHPWRFGEPPALNSPLSELPRSATTYYIHDIALLPEGQGRGHAVEAVERAIAQARHEGIGNVSLVAVNNSGAFWARRGFEEFSSPALAAKLESYGADAKFMTRRLD
ncbi:GNAT family N-acetyltransferase [Microvirga flavescens]|uniref:GNAT family N-acetyltransferase n=1 Tax=Microvirga flavescens TaxID=2249811 RepID=UPI000DD6ECB3|nr:GNAT family N-acetyltransferase [Microvirga flavescens]